MRRLAIDVKPGEYAVVRLDAAEPVPSGLFDRTDGVFVSVTRTGDETSVVCPSDVAPAAAQAERGWRLLTVRGPLAFTLTGIVAALSNELAAAGVALFGISTFDTDHLLVKAVDLDRAVDALRGAGHEVDVSDV
ncbi:amino acid-binding protein [Saccharomonospora sp. CUA-673]|uniref:ACT domain-containing protein n=1 Tax=Saccharomonospora sp. CUA-673 TaxID=1904969 RepID=UPI000969CBE9|nr:ACT domain-containing protein [Saccharomonospora sp. CUA-673]OLT44858.1 amino acid-binding protein [Saccharomonospora sp. CUA-673]